ncbi:MAG: ATP-binding cassette domain-containing protein [Crocinitomicaceae bacterium]|nr:ATP-binding cassette domain-containing protein [Crocinitomicaceae bacterium]
MVEVKNINKSFAGTQVLYDVSAKFEPGRMNLIIGASGQGKSVMAKCIVGLHEVDEGQVIYDGRDFSAMNRKQRTEIRKEIGMLFQGSALFDSLSVIENVMFPLRMFTNKTEEEMRERAAFCLNRVNIIGKDNLLPAECSGGMQKRIGIARAIAMNPKYLFCDEPNSGLDPKTSIVIDNLIRELTYEYKMTTIVITHDMNSVMEVGDHIIFINQGRKAWEGSNKEIIRTDNEEVISFVYASSFMKNLREKLINS